MELKSFYTINAPVLGDVLFTIDDGHLEMEMEN